jgi:hypothetical protein
MEIAAYFKALVQVCHIEKKGNSTAVNKEEAANNAAIVERLLNEVNYSYKDVAANDVIKGIETEAKDFNADLLVMVPHKYGFWEGILHKSKTSRMTHRTHIPLLALPNPGFS